MFQQLISAIGTYIGPGSSFDISANNTLQFYTTNSFRFNRPIANQETSIYIDACDNAVSGLRLINEYAHWRMGLQNFTDPSRTDLTFRAVSNPYLGSARNVMIMKAGADQNSIVIGKGISNAPQVGIDVLDPSLATFHVNGDTLITTENASKTGLTINTKDNPIRATRFKATTGLNDGCEIIIQRSLNANLNENTLIPNGTAVGDIQWKGADGSNYIPMGRIKVNASGNTSTNNMPSEMRFYTNSGSNNVTQRMVINEKGDVGIGTQDPSALLHLYDTQHTNGVIPLRIETNTGNLCGLQFKDPSTIGTPFSNWLWW